VIFIKDPSYLKLEKNAFVLDGILGTGFQGELSNYLSECISRINFESKRLHLRIVSIDIPSGLNGDTGYAKACIKSFLTIYLGFAKFGFFINSGPNYIENLKEVDFKLEKKYKKQAKVQLNYMDKIDYKKYLPKIEKTRHKYQAGFVLGIAGSLGMFGAAKLAALASLRSGCGIVKIISENEIPSSFYELVNYVINYSDIEQILQLCMSADSIFIGPGIGRNQKIEDFLFKILPKITKKIILDADALFHFANNLKMILPKDCVLTPHKNEMKKLLNIDEKISDEDLLEKTKKFSQDKNVIVVLKGYPTFIFHPKKETLSILGGDPGLATAGTGDVLTGMIASFASQKLNLYDASILAVGLHFKAAEIAAQEKTSYSLIATDVIEFLPKAFKSIIGL
jgi:ADP-dependent NAD(P)H-hydrate dehydratase / NAD(P)H-hydrate epimerase